jgi:hypothetical protein
MPLAFWLSFYYTIPLALYDWLYCGLYLGHGGLFDVLLVPYGVLRESVADVYSGRVLLNRISAISRMLKFPPVPPCIQRANLRYRV